jgi:hypothetical protein
MNIPTSTPKNSNSEITASNTIALYSTKEFIPVRSDFINSTTVCILEAYGGTGSGAYAGWWTVQSGVSVNGTFMSNNTFRVPAGVVKAHNDTFRLTYQYTTSPTSTLENRTNTALFNASGTGESVFNIVGVILIIGAIMTIIGLVYSYMRPRY